MTQDNKNFGKPQTPGQQQGSPKPYSQQGPGGQTPKGGGPFAEQKGSTAAWTGNEIEQLKQLVGTKTPVKAISSKLGKPEAAIQAKARELKLSL